MSAQTSRLSDGTPLNVAVYRAYRNAGLSHNQALAITAEVGRENDFNPRVLFGSHTDPAANANGGAIRNVGMLSWNQGRDTRLLDQLARAGGLRNGAMAQTQENLNAQAAFSVSEMRGQYRGKLKDFWNNPNANPEQFARVLGPRYIGWAYGQDTIRGKDGRVPFNWREQDNRRRNYLAGLAGALGDKSFKPVQQPNQPQFAEPVIQKNFAAFQAKFAPKPTFQEPPVQQNFSKFAAQHAAPQFNEPAAQQNFEQFAQSFNRG